MRKITDTDYFVSTSELPSDFNGTRYNGGWAKKITGIDKSKSNGFSIQGDWVESGKEGYYRVTEGVLYLDCDIQGSRKNQNKEYTLFTILKGEIIVLKTIKDCSSWALEFWPAIDKFLKTEISNNPLSKFSIEELQAEIERRK